MEANKLITAENEISIVSDWQIKEVRKCAEEYLEEPSIAEDFH